MMIVIVVSVCPEGLRGDLSRWLLEISAGVFVGRVTSRVRDLLWERVVALAKDGRAIMVFSQRNEQGMGFKVHRNKWDLVDAEGLNLVRRPNPEKSKYGNKEIRSGWSNASKYRRAEEAKRQR